MKAISYVVFFVTHHFMHGSSFTAILYQSRCFVKNLVTNLNCFLYKRPFYGSLIVVSSMLQCFAHAFPFLKAINVLNGELEILRLFSCCKNQSWETWDDLHQSIFSCLFWKGRGYCRINSSENLNLI